MHHDRKIYINEVIKQKIDSRLIKLHQDGDIHKTFFKENADGFAGYISS